MFWYGEMRLDEMRQGKVRFVGMRLDKVSWNEIKLCEMKIGEMKLVDMKCELVNVCIFWKFGGGWGCEDNIVILVTMDI